MGNVRLHGSTRNIAPPRADEIRFARGCALWFAYQIQRWGDGREPSARNVASLRRVAWALADVVDRGAAPQQKAA